MTHLIITLRELRSVLKPLKASGKKIGFVPTMGALHEGHGSLMAHANDKCDITVASIFVNPKQFGAGEDFDKYPRLPEDDLAFLKSYHVDYLFMPSLDEIYPKDFSTLITVSGITEIMEGLARPTHFNGMITIVVKLFMMVKPDIAFFGEKDYQQLMVIKRAIEDLSIDIEIEGVPTVRELDGLAMSSRNRYLSKDHQEKATAIYKMFQKAKEQFQQSVKEDEIIEQGKNFLLENGFSKVDYIEIHKINDEKRIFTAAYMGTTRLIDNMSL